MKTKEHNTVACPVCGYVAHASSSYTQEVAIKPGDFSICGVCCEPLVYESANPVKLRHATITDLMRLDNRSMLELSHLQQHIKATRLRTVTDL